MRVPVILIIIIAVLAIIQCSSEAGACGVPAGEQCGTDTECECMHGTDD